MKKALITGITGQDGSYLTELLLDKGYEVHGIVRRSSSFNTGRIDHLVSDPKLFNKTLHLHFGDLTDSTNIDELIRTIKPDEIYNLGAQSHVKVSFEVPEYTADANAMGPLRILEAMKKHCPNSKYYQASTSEMYGGVTEEMPEKGYNENSPFHPRSPYGVAKLYGHWIARNYRESYNMFIVSSCLFNHECFDSNTPITIKNGETIDVVYMRDFLPERKDISKDNNILIGDFSNENIEVWNGSGYTKLKTITRRKIKTLDTENRNKVVSNTRNGSVVTTPHHNFLIGQKKIPQRQLNLHDELDHGGLPKLGNHIKITEAEAKFLGMLVGDGHICSSGHVRLANLDHGETFKDLCRFLFPVFNIREANYASGYGDNTRHHNVSGISSHLGKFYRSEIYDERTKHKKVPKRILNSSLEVKTKFLEGYYLCDGLKKDKCTYKFKSFKSNSPLLCQGLILLMNEVVEGFKFNINTFEQNSRLYNQVNIHSDKKGDKGLHLIKNNKELKKEIILDESNCFVYDIETECGYLQAGVGSMVLANSPRRGDTFVTKKITNWCKKWKMNPNETEPLELGNLYAYRDWGHAKDFMNCVYLMMQQETPEDFVIATGETYTVKDFVEECFNQLGESITWKGEGINEVGLVNNKTVVKINPKYFRPAEVDILLGDSSKARKKLGWTPEYNFKTLVKDMLDN